jgi:nicotinamidase-related amidase
MFRAFAQSSSGEAMTRSALLIIDVQVAIVDGAYRAEAMLDVLGALSEKARAAGSPVIYLQHNSARYAPMAKGAPAWEIHPAVAPRADDLVVHKTASDGFCGTELQDELARLGVKRLVIGGLQTEFCVDATCRAALSRGFEVTLAGDGHSTGDAVTPAKTTIAHHNYALGNLAHPDRTIQVQPGADVVFD